MVTHGRPALYIPAYDEQAYNHCLLGGTNAGLAELLGVGPRTIDRWIADIPSFAKAVREGRAVADGRVARSLYERAIGCRRTMERTVLHEGEEKTLTSTVQLPPDTQACIFWLRNRCRDTWNVRPAIVPHEDASLTEAMIAELDAAGERARRESD